MGMTSMIGLNADWKLTTTAYAHQRAAIEKLSRLRVGALFMDMDGQDAYSS